MRSLIVCAILLLVPALRAAPPPDPILTNGLQASVTSGLPVCLGIWYAGQPKLAAELGAKLSSATKELGGVLDTEVVATQGISKRVTRYYLAIYFSRRPLWIQIDRYQIAERPVFLPLKCSLDPDAILPGYLTDIVQ